MIYFGLRPIIKLFELGSCIVFGEKGSGKDVLFGNVISRRKGPYVATMDYTKDGRFIPVDFHLLNVGNNTWRNFLTGQLFYYEYPYPRGADIYCSDLGVYLPCQYNGELNKEFPYLSTFFCLERQLGESCMHGNVQALNRIYDKYREHARRYIRCRGLFKPLMKIGLCVQKITIYSKYESGVACVEPCRVYVPLLASSEAKMNAQIHKDNFFNQHGEIKTHWFIYLNKSKHDTYFFEKLLKEGKKYAKSKTKAS